MGDVDGGGRVEKKRLGGLLHGHPQESVRAFPLFALPLSSASSSLSFELSPIHPSSSPVLVPRSLSLSLCVLVMQGALFWIVFVL